jgi:hypothetical protein
MNPYRDIERATIEVRRGRTRRRLRRKNAGYLLLVLDMCALLGIGYGSWVLVPFAIVFVVAISLAFAGRSRSAFVRLCALTWNRGDRLGATMLLFGVITPRYSAKRLARNKAALAASDTGERIWSR